MAIYYDQRLLHLFYVFLIKKPYWIQEQVFITLFSHPFCKSLKHLLLKKCWLLICKGYNISNVKNWNFDTDLILIRYWFDTDTKSKPWNETKKNKAKLNIEARGADFRADFILFFVIVVFNLLLRRQAVECSHKI